MASSLSVHQATLLTRDKIHVAMANKPQGCLLAGNGKEMPNAARGLDPTTNFVLSKRKYVGSGAVSIFL